MRPPHIAIAGDAAMVFAAAAALDRSCRAGLTLFPADLRESPVAAPPPRDGIRVARPADPPGIVDAIVFCARPGADPDVVAALIRDLGARVARACPRTALIVASPRSLALARQAARATGLDASLILAAGGMPLVERERARTAARHALCPSQVQAVVIGADQPSSLRVLPRYTTVAGIPHDALSSPSARVAAEAWAGPTAGELVRAAVSLARAVVDDRDEVFCCGARSGDGLGIPGGWITTPVRVGAAGAGEALPIGLTLEDRTFLNSVAGLADETPAALGSV